MAAMAVGREMLLGMTRKLLAPGMILNPYRSPRLGVGLVPFPSRECMGQSSPVKDMILSLGSLTECPSTISSLVGGPSPEAPDYSRLPLFNVGSWGTFSELNTFLSVTSSNTCRFQQTYIIENLHTGSFPRHIEVGHHANPLAGVLARR